jgi:WD40 repeat protein
MWDAATGALIRTLESDSGYSVAFSPDGTRVLSDTWDKLISMWDAATGALIPTFREHQAPGRIPPNPHQGRLVAFSPDRTRVLWTGWSLEKDHTIKLSDVATGALIRTFEGHAGQVSSVAFSPDGARVLSGSGGLLEKDHTIKLWDIATGALIRTFEGHSGSGVTSMAFSPDGSRVLSGGADTTIKLWDASTGALIRTFEGHSDAVWSVAFSPDGARVLSGSYGKTLKLWDAATGTLIRTFKGHSGAVNSVAFSPDGSRVLSGSLDGTMRMWKVATGEPVVTLIGGRQREWLSITPVGFFAASRNSAALLSIVRGLKVTAIDQVWQSLFNPDLVLETLAGDPEGAVREAAKVSSLDKVLVSGPAPLVEITSHKSAAKSDVVTVSARIKDRGKGIGRIEWRINGITVGVENAPAGAGPVYEVRRRLALDPGENAIEVVAYNVRNLLASLPAQVAITYTGPAGKVQPKLYVLAIGINDYVDQGGPEPGTGKTLAFLPLGASVPDANAFSDEIEKAGAGLYAEVNVTKVLNRDATRAKLDKTFKKLASEISPRDTFVFYAAAHGYSLGGNYYMIPQDYQGGLSPEAIKTRAISQEHMQDWIANRIKAKKAIILLDTCESGALTGGYTRSRTEGPVSEAAVGRLHEATGRPVLTAASTGKSAYEGYKGHGVFTYALMEALHKGDTNHNGKIEVTELAAHVERRVPELFAELKGNGWVVKGVTATAVRGIGGDAQSAHFGSTGGDFALVNKLP